MGFLSFGAKVLGGLMGVGRAIFGRSSGIAKKIATKAVPLITKHTGLSEDTANKIMSVGGEAAQALWTKHAPKWKGYQTFSTAMSDVGALHEKITERLHKNIPVQQGSNPGQAYKQGMDQNMSVLTGKQKEQIQPKVTQQEDVQMKET